MTVKENTSLDMMISQLEESWSLLDQLFEKIEAQGGWETKHGDDWIYADVPYHIYYCDRYLTSEMLSKGSDLQEEELWEAKTFRELNAWNDSQFEKRPKGQNVSKTLQDMQESREDVRNLLSEMSDEDLDRPTWFPLVFRRGWRTARTPLAFCRDHNWLEFIQLRNLMSLDEPKPSQELTNAAINNFMNNLCSFLNSENSKGESFKMIWKIEGSGGGEWTVTVEDGDCRVNQELISNPDLEIRLTPGAFVTLTGGMTTPHSAVQPDHLTFSNEGGPELFFKLFRPFEIDQVIPPGEYF